MSALLAIFPVIFTIAPPISRTCEVAANRLLFDQTMGYITEVQASDAFLECQRIYPPLDPSQPAS